MDKLFHVLTDEGSFFALHSLDDCGVETALISILSRPVSALYVSQDVKDGAEKIVLQLFDKALQMGVPVLLLFSSQETLAKTVDLPAMQKALVRLSGVCPVLSIVEKEAGEMALALLPFADFCIFASGSHERSASVIQTLDLPDAIENLRTLLSYLPLNCAENVPRTIERENRSRTQKTAQAANSILTGIADHAAVYELYADTHIKLSFARINGRSVGIMAAEQESLPSHAARFIQFCDCFSLPLIVIAECALSLNAQQIFMLAQATIPIIGIGNNHSIASLIDVNITTNTDDLRADVSNALEYLSVKHDVLPPHKHGNLPL